LIKEKLGNIFIKIIISPVPNRNFYLKDSNWWVKILLL